MVKRHQFHFIPIGKGFYNASYFRRNIHIFIVCNPGRKTGNKVRFRFQRLPGALIIITADRRGKPDIQRDQNDNDHAQAVDQPAVGNAFQMRIPFQPLSIPFITKTPYRLNIDRMRRLIFNFHTKTANVYINDFIIAIITVTPDLV